MYQIKKLVNQGLDLEKLDPKLKRKIELISNLSVEFTEKNGRALQADEEIMFSEIENLMAAMPDDSGIKIKYLSDKETAENEKRSKENAENAKYEFLQKNIGKFLDYPTLLKNGIDTLGHRSFKFGPYLLELPKVQTMFRRYLVTKTE